MELMIRKDRGNSFKFRLASDKSSIKVSEVRMLEKVKINFPKTWPKQMKSEIEQYLPCVKITFL